MLLLRMVIIVAAALIMGSCSSIYKGVADTFHIARSQKQRQPDFSQAQIDAIPYAQSSVRFGNINVLFILTRISNNNLYWQDTAQESLIEENGVIVRTSGLINNIEQSQFIGESPFSKGLQNVINGTTAKREIDFSDYKYGTISESVFYQKGTETITITEKPYTLQRIEEIVSNNDIGLNATNIYWVDNTGFIWQSQQTLLPNLTLTISQIKPYRAAQ